ncbi:MAG TPA: hypothetical protein VK436_09020 [Methanocella sp.]|nr:hypothetical protein [Methanocella sp.]
MDSDSNQSSEHMHNWLKKLKESQERRRDEKIRRYNDVVSKLIILLIGVCIVCIIIIAALGVQNENMRTSYDRLEKSYNQLAVNNTTYYNLSQGQALQLGKIETTAHTIYINKTGHANPNVSRVIYNFSYATIVFEDGINSTTQFADANSSSGR